MSRIDSVMIAKDKFIRSQVNSEKKDGFSNINRMIKYNKKYSEHQKNAYLFLKSLKQKKFSIHGFGASAGSTSIFYQYKLKDFL